MPSRRPRWYLPWIAAVGALFWALRIAYWSQTEERPFSDMECFELIARGVLERFDFRFGEFWATYRPPVLPLLRAGVLGVFGPDENLWAWRFVQAALTFGGALWLSAEVSAVAGRIYGALLFAVIALSKASIFWSLKLASEGVSEALLYLALAAAIRSARSPRSWIVFAAGALCAAAWLARPALIVLLAVPAVLGLCWIVAELRARVPSDAAVAAKGWRRGRAAIGVALRRVLPMLAAIALVWSPWLIRSYRLYGHVVPLTTQGPYSFLWELGEIQVRGPDGAPLGVTANSLQAEAQRLFANDYQASRYAAGLARQWLAEQPREYLCHVGRRLMRTARDKTIYLTKVSRRRLFGNAIDRLLLDKNVYVFFSGLAGLLLLGMRRGALLALPMAVIGVWLSTALVIGYPRVVEPVLPLVLFGNAGWLLPLAWLRSRVVRSA